MTNMIDNSMVGSIIIIFHKNYWKCKFVKSYSVNQPVPLYSLGNSSLVETKKRNDLLPKIIFLQIFHWIFLHWLWAPWIISIKERIVFGFFYFICYQLTFYSLLLLSECSLSCREARIKCDRCSHWCFEQSWLW